MIWTLHGDKNIYRNEGHFCNIIYLSNLSV